MAQSGSTSDPDEYAGHVLDKVPGNLPCNDVVWACNDCGERRTKKRFFTNFSCPPQDDDHKTAKHVQVPVL